MQLFGSCQIPGIRGVRVMLALVRVMRSYGLAQQVSVSEASVWIEIRTRIAVIEAAPSTLLQTPTRLDLFSEYSVMQRSLFYFSSFDIYIDIDMYLLYRCQSCASAYPWDS